MRKGERGEAGLIVPTVGKCQDLFMRILQNRQVGREKVSRRPTTENRESEEHGAASGGPRGYPGTPHSSLPALCSAFSIDDFRLQSKIAEAAQRVN